MAYEDKKTEMVHQEEAMIWMQDQVRTYSVMHNARTAKKDCEPKDVLSVRLPVKTIKKARAMGKGYTCILAEIIEKAVEEAGHDDSTQFLSE